MSPIPRPATSWPRSRDCWAISRSRRFQPISAHNQPSLVAESSAMRLRSALLMAVLMGLAAGCQNEQSVLQPQGPQAVQIAHLAWVLIAICVIVLAVVLVTLWLAVRGSTRVRARLAERSTVIVAGIVFPAVTLTGLLGYSVWLMQPKPPEFFGEDVLRIEVAGEQWWWRVAYIAADGKRCERQRDSHSRRPYRRVRAPVCVRYSQFLGTEPRRQGGYDLGLYDTATTCGCTARRLSRPVCRILRRAARADGATDCRDAGGRACDLVDARGSPGAGASERNRTAREIDLSRRRLRWMSRYPWH